MLLTLAFNYNVFKVTTAAVELQRKLLPFSLIHLSVLPLTISPLSGPCLYDQRALPLLPLHKHTTLLHQIMAQSG